MSDDFKNVLVLHDLNREALYGALRNAKRDDADTLLRAAGVRDLLYALAHSNIQVSALYRGERAPLVRHVEPNPQLELEPLE